MTGDSRLPAEVVEINDTATYSGKYRLFWILIHATVASTVTVSDNTTELMSLYVAANDCKMWTFTPSVTVQTSLVVTKSSGTCKITTSKAPA